MTHDPLPGLLQEWAAQEPDPLPTALTPALLRCKHALAAEDARRSRARNLQTLLVTLPVALAALLILPWISPVYLGEFIARQSPGILLAILGTLGISAYVGGTWVME